MCCHLQASSSIFCQIDLTLFYFILFYFILFYFILFYFLLFYFILFHFILFYFILFYFILSYPRRDECGRRHSRPPGGENQEDPRSLVDLAIDVIRRSAVNISAYKMDLRQAFLDFDTSGDGFLSCEEMVSHVII